MYDEDDPMHHTYGNIGVRLLGVDAAELKARLNSGELLFVRGIPKPPTCTCCPIHTPEDHQ